MSEQKNIFQRINNVRKSLAYIKKDAEVDTGRGKYKAVTHDQVTAQIRPHLVAEGIVSYPVLVSSVMNPPLVDKDMVASKQRLYESTYDFVFVNEDNPEDKITIRIESHGMDNQDKAPGKALSMAYKYALLKLFNLETGENEESRYDDFDDLINDIKEATTEEDALDAYQVAVSVATSRRDPDGIALAKATVRKRKEELDGAK